jgi:hypothetical protein
MDFLLGFVYILLHHDVSNFIRRIFKLSTEHYYLSL